MKLVALAALVGAGSVINLQALMLKPAEVGKGYAMYARTDGFGVASAPTLDLCGRSGYTSEKLRIGRLQVNFLSKTAKLGLSNEIVRYKAGGAAKALNEVRQHAAGCPARAIKTGEPDVPVARFTITPVHDKNLLPGAVAVKVRAVATVKGKKYDQISYAVYQRLGDVLSGVYSFGPDTPAQQRFALHAAELSAKALRRVVQAPKGPPA